MAEPHHSKGPSDKAKADSRRRFNMHILALAVLYVSPATGYVLYPTEAPAPASPDSNCAPNSSKIDIGARATCTFIQEVDVDETRWPAKLPKVKCICPGKLCTTKGDFRCTEVVTRFSVLYLRRSTHGPTLTEETIQLPTSCVCATSMAGTSLPYQSRSHVIVIPEVTFNPLRIPFE